jgi:hypothetical protein
MPKAEITGQGFFGMSLVAEGTVHPVFDSSGQRLFNSLSQGGHIRGQVVQLVRAEIPLETDNLRVHLRQTFIRARAWRIRCTNEFVGPHRQFAERGAQLVWVEIATPLVSRGRLSESRLRLVHYHCALLAGFSPLSTLVQQRRL